MILSEEIIPWSMFRSKLNIDIDIPRYNRPKDVFISTDLPLLAVDLRA